MSQPQFLATGIGSLPHRLAEDACGFIADTFPADIPFWPQLPKKSFLENMYVQFSQNFPGIVIEEKEKKISVDTAGESFNSDLEAALQNYLDNNLEYFAINKDYAGGLYKFLSILPDLNNAAFIKGQIIGPITFGLALLDQNQQPAIYHPELADCLVKFLAMKAKWQVKKLQDAANKKKVVIFIDEPYLVSFGSSFFTLDRVEVVKRINEVIAAVHQAGAMAGIHCCGNTDWFLVLDTDLDILSFDAANFLESFLIYRPRLNRFLDKGGWIAWGIVSNKETPDWDLDNGVEKLSQILETKCEGLLRNTVLITPSCGCGTLEQNFSEKVHRLSVELAKLLREKYS